MSENSRQYLEKVYKDHTSTIQRVWVDALETITDNILPEELYGTDAMAAWAEEQGYVQVGDDAPYHPRRQS